MNKLQKYFLTCLCFVSIAAPYPMSYAQSRPGALSFTFGGGYEYFASKRRMENTGLGFFALGYDFTEHWGLEGFLAGFRTNFQRNVGDNSRIGGTLFAVDGIYHFNPDCLLPPSYTLQPYLLAGFGVTGLNPNRTDANNEGNINAGLGLALSLHHAVALRLEARDFYTIVGGKNDVIVDGGISFIFDLC